RYYYQFQCILYLERPNCITGTDNNIVTASLKPEIAVFIFICLVTRYIILTALALFREYYKDSERTKMSQRGEYYVTGDHAYKDEDGYFWFEGRSDDIIISSGYTIGPFEVEDALVKHPFVQECAVVASPDEVRGNVVKAFIVLQD